MTVNVLGAVPPCISAVIEPVASPLQAIVAFCAGVTDELSESVGALVTLIEFDAT